MRINKGDKIEDIELPDSYGNTFKLSSTKGKKVLLTFYRHASCAVCNLRINEFVNYINLNDPNALVIFQADHGLLKEGVVNSQEIFTLAKVPKECEDYLTRKVDNINGIRLLLSCATNQKVKLLEV